MSSPSAPTGQRKWEKRWVANSEEHRVPRAKTTKPTTTRKRSAPDHFKKVADELDREAPPRLPRQKDGQLKAGPLGHSDVPSFNRMGKIVYSTSYMLTYGIAFPLALIGASMPADNPVSRGMADVLAAAKAKAHRGKPGGKSH